MSCQILHLMNYNVFAASAAQSNNITVITRYNWFNKQGHFNVSQEHTLYVPLLSEHTSPKKYHSKSLVFGFPLLGLAARFSRNKSKKSCQLLCWSLVGSWSNIGSKDSLLRRVGSTREAPEKWPNKHFDSVNVSGPLGHAQTLVNGENSFILIFHSFSSFV